MLPLCHQVILIILRVSDTKHAIAFGFSNVLVYGCKCLTGFQILVDSNTRVLLVASTYKKAKSALVA